MTVDTVANPFARAAVPKEAWIRRLLRLPQTTSAVAEIKNILAEQGVRGLTTATLGEILSRRRVLGTNAKQMLRSVWGEAAQAFASDGYLNDPEIGYLTALRGALSISDAEVATTLQAIGEEALRSAWRAAARDGEITREERERIETIIGQFAVSDDAATAIRRSTSQEVYQAAFDRAIEDRQLSPLEDDELRRLTKGLAVAPSFDEKTLAQLDRFRLLWQITNASLPTIAASISLQRGEVCHLRIPANWHEIRKKTTRVGYSGPVATIRIMKGLSYRVGSYTPHRVTRDVLTHIDSGTLYATNKRVIFDGARKNTAIRYSSIIGIDPYSDGVGIEKASGRSPILTLDGDIEIATAILCEALARSSQ